MRGMTRESARGSPLRSTNAMVRCPATMDVSERTSVASQTTYVFFETTAAASLRCHVVTHRPARARETIMAASDATTAAGDRTPVAADTTAAASDRATAARHPTVAASHHTLVFSESSHVVRLAAAPQPTRLHFSSPDPRAIPATCAVGEEK
jgi:hypothetical protein